MSDELERLLDQAEIIDTINQLFIGTDNRDWPQVKNCLALRVQFDMSSLGIGPPKELSSDEIVAMWNAGLKPLKAIHHQTGNYRVHITGTRAQAFCYGIASHYLPNKTGRNTRTFVGSYDFALIKDSERWRIDQLKFSLKYIDGNPDLERS